MDAETRSTGLKFGANERRDSSDQFRVVGRGGAEDASWSSPAASGRSSAVIGGEFTIQGNQLGALGPEHLYTNNNNLSAPATRASVPGNRKTAVYNGSSRAPALLSGSFGLEFDEIDAWDSATSPGQRDVPPRETPPKWFAMASMAALVMHQLVAPASELVLCFVDYACAFPSSHQPVASNY